MANKFLNIGGGSINLSNGSVSIYASSLASKELQPSFPVKTDSLNKLVSEKLDISDVNNLQEQLDSVLTNPLTVQLTTNQTNFTQDQQLVTKKYVDDSGGGGAGNKEIFDFTGLNESTYLSPLTGNSSGIENVLYNGEFVTVKSAITASAGRVMSFDASTNNASEYTIDFCNGGTGEQNASSQVLGILLDDVVAGEYCRVATKGICSVLVGSTTTAQRGCMVTLGGSASSYQGRVVCTSRTANEPSCGICMSYGSKSINQPIVVLLQTTFESY